MAKRAQSPHGYPGTKRKVARYGWVRDLPDQRDYTYATPKEVKVTPDVDLRPQCPKVYDQGQIGSCTANAIAGAIEFDRLKQKLADFVPSRLFIYYNERAIEGTIPSDSGAQLRDGIKSVASQGDCPETEWPYDDTPADPKTGLFPKSSRAVKTPTAKCYADAKQHRAITYHSINQNLADMQGCLSEGYPFVFGFTVYESFEEYRTWKNWTAPMPQQSERTIGGHAVVAVGYDNAKHVFIIRNSWGEAWGLKGYFYMPYAYLLDNNLSNDFWTIRVVQ